MRDRVRADVALVQREQAQSREKAQALIMAGLVFLRERKILKPSEPVEPEDELIVRAPAHDYVGRGALKLEKALSVFHAEVAGRVALDIGAATGGFSDVLLRSGASHVYAIDVGYGQLDWQIRNDKRVTVMERTNARYLQREQFPLLPTLTVMDVSFISVKLILPVAAMLMDGVGAFYILIKPQFEAGRDLVGKKGVVRDPVVHRLVIQSIVDFAPQFAYGATQLDFSPITGPEGNIEYLAELLPLGNNTACIDTQRIADVVALAHETLVKRG